MMIGAASNHVMRSWFHHRQQRNGDGSKETAYPARVLSVRMSLFLDRGDGA
jgi:hypothetical protein